VDKYAIMGLKAKVKVNTHIAKAEFCSMVFAPVFLETGADSMTLISKLGRLMLMFNAIRKSSIKTNVNDYVFENLMARRNSL
jgi:hypothetical protein